MEYSQLRDLIQHPEEHSAEEIESNMSYINNYLREICFWPSIKTYLKKISKIVDKDKILLGLFENEKKFSWWDEILDIPENLKFGVEIEVTQLNFDLIEYIFKSNSISKIMRILNMPPDIVKSIVNHSDFEKKDEPDKWIFSRESGTNNSEASSPILQNHLFDLNQIVAICNLFKALNADLNGGTGLHINVGVDYFQCNEKAIGNLLRIWGECEEMFFKMANPEGEIIRVVASNMAIPIKENIQNFFDEFDEKDGSITLNTDEDMERFLYLIQVRNRIEQFGSYLDLQCDSNLGREERYFQKYRQYEKRLRETGETNSEARWTSINFNHMKWNTASPGRIEIRIFNSSLEPEIIFQDLLLVGKLFEVSFENAKNPNYKSKEFEKLFLRNVTEAEKINNLLKLLFDNEEQRIIFKRRWESVKDENAYQKFYKGRDTFERN